MIRVIDDGGGMAQDDALLAFERHATSKLRTPTIYSPISTLGFRGERYLRSRRSPPAAERVAAEKRKERGVELPAASS